MIIEVSLSSILSLARLTHSLLFLTPLILLFLYLSTASRHNTAYNTPTSPLFIASMHQSHTHSKYRGWGLQCSLSLNIATGIPYLTNITIGIPYLTNIATGIPYLTNIATGIPYLTNIAIGILYLTNIATGIPYLTNIAIGIPYLTNIAIGIPYLTNIATGILISPI